MTPQIELSEIVKNKLEKYKDIEGCKTFNEAVNLLISKNGLSSELLFDMLEAIEKERDKCRKQILDGFAKRRKLGVEEIFIVE